jgi:exodeoxyribonuclease VII large subunit
MFDSVSHKKPLSVSQFTETLRTSIEETFSWVQIQGEISNFKAAPSGHVYFRLKDDDAVLECVAWRSTVVRWAGLDLKDGVEVIAGGKVTVYSPRGQYQLVVNAIRLAGVGALQLRFEALKKLLAEEGLFDDKYKKPLPNLPQKIAVITSPTGAAIRDFIKIVKMYHCPVDVTVCPVLVQGVDAPAEISAMIETVNKLSCFDIVVVCRGGGSLEDLWAFNEEIVARAIYQSKTPVISAIGHEIDFTIADFVADERAPTPTAAGLLIADIFGILQEKLNRNAERLIQSVIPSIDRFRSRLELTTEALKRYHPLSVIENKRQKLDECTNFLTYAMKTTVEKRTMQLKQFDQSLKINVMRRLEKVKSDLFRFERLIYSYDPHKNLERGYSICRKPDGSIIRKLSDIESTDIFNVTLSNGSFGARVEKVK